MKKVLGILGLAAAVTMPAAYLAPATAHADNKPPPCQKKDPSKSCGSAVTVTSYSGTFRVPVFQTKLVLKGHASKASHGTQIYAQRTAASHVPAHAVAFRVFAVGHLPTLTLVQRAQLYAYATSTNTWSRAASVTRSGVYAAVVK
jgi:hypothetical protein